MKIKELVLFCASLLAMASCEKFPTFYDGFDATYVDVENLTVNGKLASADYSAYTALQGEMKTGEYWMGVFDSSTKRMLFQLKSVLKSSEVKSAHFAIASSAYAVELQETSSDVLRAHVYTAKAAEGNPDLRESCVISQYGGSSSRYSLLFPWGADSFLYSLSGCGQRVLSASGKQLFSIEEEQVLFNSTNTASDSYFWEAVCDEKEELESVLVSKTDASHWLKYRTNDDGAIELAFFNGGLIKEYTRLVVFYDVLAGESLEISSNASGYFASRAAEVKLGYAKKSGSSEEKKTVTLKVEGDSYEVVIP